MSTSRRTSSGRGSGDAEPTPGQRPNSRERILDTALHLMAERGADNTSMRTLAKACEINVAALYHYFESKDALLVAVIEERRYDVLLSEVPDLDHTAPPGDRLVDLFLAFWDGAQEEEDVWRLLLVEGFRAHPAALSVGTELLGSLQAALLEWTTELFPELSVPAEDAARVIGTTLMGLFIDTRFDPGTNQRAVVADRARHLTPLLFHDL